MDELPHRTYLKRFLGRLQRQSGQGNTPPPILHKLLIILVFFPPIFPKNNAELGAYISSSHAEEIVKNNGMLELSNQNLREAFAKLISDTSYVFTISNENVNQGKDITVSVNNIYLDHNHSFLFNDIQKKVQKSSYGDYSKTFDFWFENAIFTSSTDIFSKGSSFVFDARKNYGNIEIFFKTVVGFDFAKNSLAVTLLDENNNLYEETALINSVSKKYGNSPSIWLLLLSISAFSLLFVLFQATHKMLTKKKRIIFTFIPLILYLFFQILFYFLEIIHLKKFILYSFFNAVGNVIFIVAFLIIVMSIIIRSLYVKNHSK